jgi:hypothetical protein
MRQPESPLEPVNLDTVHLGVPCGRYDLMREVHQYPYYPTAYPYAGTIAGDSQRQPTTQIQTTSDLRRQQATNDNQSKRIQNRRLQVRFLSHLPQPLIPL